MIQHLSAEQIQALALGAPLGEAGALAQQHLQDCRACSMLVAREEASRVVQAAKRMKTGDFWRIVSDVHRQIRAAEDESPDGRSRDTYATAEPAPVIDTLTYAARVATQQLLAGSSMSRFIALLNRAIPSKQLRPTVAVCSRSSEECEVFRKVLHGYTVTPVDEGVGLYGIVAGDVIADATIVGPGFAERENFIAPERFPCGVVAMGDSFSRGFSSWSEIQPERIRFLSSTFLAADLRSAVGHVIRPRRSTRTSKRGRYSLGAWHQDFAQ